MKIIVWGSDEQVAELKKGKENINWVRLVNLSDCNEHPDADAFFDLAGQCDHYVNTYPVFVNKVHESLPLQKNLIRINGWPGFLKNETWELAGNISDDVSAVLSALGKKFILCKDEPGFISARIISMVINEAFMAKEEGVSTESEIDVAMKLGTNYPYGPFEWAAKIGIQSIYELLTVLSKQDARYTPAASMNT